MLTHIGRKGSENGHRGKRKTPFFPFAQSLLTSKVKNKKSRKYTPRLQVYRTFLKIYSRDGLRLLLHLAQSLLHPFTTIGAKIPPNSPGMRIQIRINSSVVIAISV
ncbi:hypothetical protein B5F38_00165 [Barnesiella sp. An22]|nr:hypothetical protein B5F38_00165 [Barnesiella sp. An22]